jgi:peptidoglycan hydrolase CwlO-like protein
MAEVCKDIDAALAALNNKIDAQNGRIRELERKQKECCDSKDGKQSPSDLSELYNRIAAIENYINIFDSACKSATSSLQLLRNIFKF